jgi:hypothetical protein
MAKDKAKDKDNYDPIGAGATDAPVMIPGGRVRLPADAKRRSKNWRGGEAR